MDRAFKALIWVVIALIIGSIIVSVIEWVAVFAFVLMIVGGVTAGVAYAVARVVRRRREVIRREREKYVPPKVDRSLNAESPIDRLAPLAQEGNRTAQALITDYAALELLVQRNGESVEVVREEFNSLFDGMLSLLSVQKDMRIHPRLYADTTAIDGLVAKSYASLEATITDRMRKANEGNVVKAKAAADYLTASEGEVGR